MLSFIQRLFKRSKADKAASEKPRQLTIWEATLAGSTTNRWVSSDTWHRLLNMQQRLSRNCELPEDEPAGEMAQTAVRNRELQQNTRIDVEALQASAHEKADRRKATRDGSGSIEPESARKHWFE